MNSKYNNAFTNRINDYIYAIERYPHVLSEEFENIINELDLQENDILLNIDGVASPIHKYIENKSINIYYKVIDSNIDFCKYYELVPFNYNQIPYLDNSIDKIIINASLHHVSIKDRLILYKEVYRILKKNGIFLVNDVINYSKEAYWLNTIVDKYNPNGHNGNFFDMYDKPYFESIGFQVIVKRKKYKWYFYSKEEVIDFIKKLFYLKNIENDIFLYELIEKNLELKYNHEEKIYYFHWTLIYFICTK